jgi:catechol 2,3-dioxygenase-like lactoylglutathione lyase family enzyme
MMSENAMMPKITGFDHVAIEVDNIEEALLFYTKILGLEEMQTPEEVKTKGIRWLSLPGNQSLHIVETKDSKAPGTAHLAIIVEEVESWEKYLKDHNIETHPPKFDLYKAKRIFFKDPSGNRIEFVKWL